MQRFKHFTGVKIFIAVWALVLLIPSWRNDAFWQASYDPTVTKEGDNSSLVMAVDEREFKLKSLLGVSTETSVAKIQPVGQDESTLLLALQEVGPGYRNYIYEKASPELRQETDAWFERYAVLSKRLPKSAMVRSQWLCAVASVPLAVESPGQLATYKMPDTAAMNVCWLSVKQRETAIDCARQGARLEPANAFWPWMEAVLNFSLRREEAGLASVEKASRCTAFDSGVATLLQKRLDLMNGVRGVKFEDKLALFWNPRLGHLGKIRSACRAAMWQAELAQKRGDKKRALDIAEILQNAGLPLVRSEQWIVTTLVGQAICYMAWRGTIKNAGLDIPRYDPYSGQTYDDYLRLAVEGYAAYARKNGRETQAAEALQIQSTFSGRDLRDAMQYPEVDTLAGAVQTLARYQWQGAWLLRLVAAGTLLWALSLVPLRRGELVPEARRTGLVISAFCMGAMAAVFYISIKMGAVGESVFAPSQPASTPVVTSGPTGFDYRTNLPFILFGLWFVPITLTTIVSQFWLVREKEKKRVSFGPFTIMSALRLILGMEFAALLLIWNSVGPRQLFLPLFSLVSATVLVNSVFHIRRAKGRKRWAAVFFWSAPLTFFFGIIILGKRLDFAGYLEMLLVLPLVFLFISAVCAANLPAEERNRPGSLLGDFIVHTNTAAATLTLSGTAAYLCLFLAAIPIRHHGDQVLEAQLKQGEFAYIEQRLKTVGYPAGSASSSS